MKKPLAARLTALGIAAVLGACGFHPLYGEIDHREAGQSVFGSVYVDPIVGERIGYELRNDLIDTLKGPDKPDSALYRLKVTTTQGTEGIAVEPDASITRYNYNLAAEYQLSNMRTGAVVKRGQQVTLASYDVVESPYATLVAKQNAQKRAAEEVAYRIRVDLAVFFHNGAK